MQRQSRARWTKSGWDGSGTLSTGSGTIREEPFTWKTRNGANGGMNPEELLAAALASCFAMAVAFALDHSGFQPDQIDVTANVCLATDDGTFEISGAELLLEATVEGIDNQTFRRIADAAKANCPVSLVLNLDVKLEAQLRL
jgi:osmotically inducible protein OsmC